MTSYVNPVKRKSVEKFNKIDDPEDQKILSFAYLCAIRHPDPESVKYPTACFIKFKDRLFFGQNKRQDLKDIQHTGEDTLRWDTNTNGYHAEFEAFLKLLIWYKKPYMDLSEAKVYSAQSYPKSIKTRMSKPCGDCIRLMRTRGIYQLFYTDYDYSIGKDKTIADIEAELYEMKNII